MNKGAVQTSLSRRGVIPVPISVSSRQWSVRTYANGKSNPPPSTSVGVEEDIPAYFQPVQPSSQQQQQQEPSVYQAAPLPPAQTTAAAPKASSFWSDVPPLVWIGVGVLLANVVSSALEFVKGGPQKMQEMAMQQMMKQMMKQAGAGGAGANPFGAGANPFGGAAGASPFGGAAGASPFGAGANPFGGAAGSGPSTPSSSAAYPAVDTTATDAKVTSETKAATTTTTETTTETSMGGQEKKAASEPAPKKKSAFVDVDVEAPKEPKTTTASSSMPPPPVFDAQPVSSESSSTSSSSTNDASGMLDMLKNPEMQKMLYPYLPEPMRNPETFEWMLNSPEYRSQLESMLSQQMGAGAPDAMQELLNDADMSPDKMKAQFDALGMSPEEFVQKVMSDPDLATSMTKPSVMAAIAECTKNPMSIFKYQNDEEVMRVFEKMSTLFPQAAGMGAGFPPPGSTPPSS